MQNIFVIVVCGVLHKLFEVTLTWLSAGLYLTFLYERNETVRYFLEPVESFFLPELIYADIRLIGSH